MTAEILLVLVAAFGAGVVDAMAGGGGLIQLPALFATFPQAPHTTLLGTGKLAGLAGTVSAALRYVRHVRLDRALVASASGAAFVAALGGAWIATRIPPAQFRAMVPLLLALVFLYTLLHRDFGRDHRPRRAGHHGRWLAAAGAGTIGLYDGFFGPGTGSFLVFMFVRLFGLTGELYWLLGLAMAACNVAGAQVGSHLAIRHGSGFVRVVFIVVVGCLIAKTGLDALRAAG